MKIAYVVIGAILLAVLAGAGGFFGGMTYAQSQAQNTVANFARQRAVQNQQEGTNGATATNANNPCGFGGQAFQLPAGAGQGNAPQGATQGTGTGTQGQQDTGRRQGSGQFGAPGGAFGGFGGAQLGNCVARGQVKAVNGDTVEISTADKVITVKVNDATVITKTDRGTAADVQVGDRVTVFSHETGDSPTASGIQLQKAVPQTTQ